VNPNEKKTCGMDHHYPYHYLFLDSSLQPGVFGAGYVLASMCFFSYLLSRFEIMHPAPEEASGTVEKQSSENLRFSTGLRVEKGLNRGKGAINPKFKSRGKWEALTFWIVLRDLKVPRQ
jgi:hypothetical protein